MYQLYIVEAGWLADYEADQHNQRTKLDVGSWSGSVYEQRNGLSRDREVYLYLSFILTSTEASVKLLYSNWKYTYEWDEPFAAKLLYLHFQFIVFETTLMLV